jgi:hypothetical protein
MSTFSERPYPPRREPEPEAYPVEAPLVKREPGLRINWRRMLGGFAFLFLVVGAILVCFVEGGLFNPVRHWDGRTFRNLDGVGHVFGYVFLGVGAACFVFLFSLEKRH